MIKIELLCTVDDNGKIVSGRTNLIKALQSFAGKRIRLTIERQFKKRTPKQNNAFHGYVMAMLQERLIELGWKEAVSESWTKDLIKLQCLKTETVNELTGEVMPSIKPTSGLSTSEFMELLADIQQWAAEKLDLYIPDPNEQTEIELK